MTVGHNLAARIFAESSTPAESVFLSTEDGRAITYGALERDVRRIVSRLSALGAQAGDRVAVQVEKSREAVALYFACLWIGAVYLPLNTAYTLAELEYFFADAEPALVVCSPRTEAEIRALAARLGIAAVATLAADGSGSLLQGRNRDAGDEPAIVSAKDDLAAILYTSGTTGRPKGAMITHGNLISNARMLAEIWQFRQSDVLIHALPIFHIHGLFVAINVVALAGASLIFLRAFDESMILTRMPEATVMMGVPTFYTRLLRNPGLTRDATRHMRLFVSGSAPLLAETHHEWRARTGHAILERYGMTETGMNASNPYAGERIAGTVGLPLPGVELRIRDTSTGNPAAAGEVGMIEVRGPNVFRGYWRAPEKTRTDFTEDGFFRTGDLGRIDSAGYLQIVGRGRDLIISGGYNVYPKEVETEIDLLPGVVESAVIGLPHPDLGEAVTAVVVGRIEEGAVLAGLAGRLARYKLPRRVFMVDELPRNAMGKVQKNVLRNRHSAAFRAEAEERRVAGT